MKINVGSTSTRLQVNLTRSDTGAPLTGVTHSSAGLTCYRSRGDGTATAISLVSKSVGGAFTSGGFVEVDATNMPGTYQFDAPDASFLAGAPDVVFCFRGAANMQPATFRYELVRPDVNVIAVSGSLAALDATLVDDIWAKSIDGQPAEKIMEVLLAFMGGIATTTDNGSTVTIAYKGRNGTTTKLEITASKTGGVRSTTGVIG